MLSTHLQIHVEPKTCNAKVIAKAWWYCYKINSSTCYYLYINSQWKELHTNTPQQYMLYRLSVAAVDLVAYRWWWYLCSILFIYTAESSIQASHHIYKQVSEKVKFISYLNKLLWFLLLYYYLYFHLMLLLESMITFVRIWCEVCLRIFGWNLTKYKLLQCYLRSRWMRHAFLVFWCMTFDL